jgi:hypothetical protein
MTLSKKDKKGIVLIAVAIVALFAMVIANFAAGNKPKPGADLCLGTVTRNTVLLLDYSEEISDQTLDEIKARALSYIDKKVKVGEKVTIFTISELSKSSLRPIVSVCKPAEDGSRLTEDVRHIKKRYRSEFLAPLSDSLSRRPTTSKQSPIAQALTDISLTQYLRGEQNALLVFSDMLENTDRFSLYKCQSSDQSIPRYRASRTGAMERPQFKHTNVQLHLIPREGGTPVMLQCRDRLWAWFFGDSEGNSAQLDVSYLPGGTPNANKNVTSND